jgi:hypothetical protein
MEMMGSKGSDFHGSASSRQAGGGKTVSQFAWLRRPPGFAPLSRGLGGIPALRLVFRLLNCVSSRFIIYGRFATLK